MTDENLRPSIWSLRNLLIGGALLAVAFLAGFLWQWTAASDAREERDELQVQLTFSELENELASAVIQAQHGAFEGAREQMSRFFTGLQSDLERAPSDASRDLHQILSRRDAVITALSRSDPASANLLARIYTRYQVAMGGPEVGIPIPAPEAVDSLPGSGTTGAGGEGPRGPGHPAGE